MFTSWFVLGEIPEYIAVIVLTSILFFVLAKQYKPLLKYLLLAIAVSLPCSAFVAFIVSKAFFSTLWQSEGGAYGISATVFLFIIFSFLTVLGVTLSSIVKFKKDMSAISVEIKRPWLLIFFPLYFVLNVLLSLVKHIDIHRQTVMEIAMGSAISFAFLLFLLVICIGLLQLKNWARYLALIYAFYQIAMFFFIRVPLLVRWGTDTLIKTDIFLIITVMMKPLLPTLMVYYLFRKKTTMMFVKANK